MNGDREGKNKMQSTSIGVGGQPPEHMQVSLQANLQKCGGQSSELRIMRSLTRAMSTSLCSVVVGVTHAHPGHLFGEVVVVCFTLVEPCATQDETAGFCCMLLCVFLAESLCQTAVHIKFVQSFFHQ
jgi:hypothetical protein